MIIPRNQRIPLFYCRSNIFNCLVHIGPVEVPKTLFKFRSRVINPALTKFVRDCIRKIPVNDFVQLFVLSSILSVLLTFLVDAPLASLVNELNPRRSFKHAMSTHELPKRTGYLSGVKKVLFVLVRVLSLKRSTAVLLRYFLGHLVRKKLN